MPQVLRRHNSLYESARFKLFGLDAGADYVVSDLDTSTQERHSAHVLLDDGLPATIVAKPGGRF